ncbi:hypothetical protein NMY22_g18749 [Coprinellus aureogranulatus]|nr:hypothetical protein NMY22_g18749 [Coprinellus aureogranulatus]
MPKSHVTVLSRLVPPTLTGLSLAPSHLISGSRLTSLDASAVSQCASLNIQSRRGLLLVSRNALRSQMRSGIAYASVSIDVQRRFGSATIPKTFPRYPVVGIRDCLTKLSCFKPSFNSSGSDSQGSAVVSTPFDDILHPATPVVKKAPTNGISIEEIAPRVFEQLVASDDSLHLPPQSPPARLSRLLFLTSEEAHSVPHRVTTRTAIPTVASLILGEPAVVIAVNGHLEDAEDSGDPRTVHSRRRLLLFFPNPANLAVRHRLNPAIQTSSHSISRSAPAGSTTRGRSAETASCTTSTPTPIRRTTRSSVRTAHNTDVRRSKRTREVGEERAERPGKRPNLRQAAVPAPEVDRFPSVVGPKDEHRSLEAQLKRSMDKSEHNALRWRNTCPVFIDRSVTAKQLYARDKKSVKDKAKAEATMDSMKSWKADAGSLALVDKEGEVIFAYCGVAFQDPSLPTLGDFLDGRVKLKDLPVYPGSEGRTEDDVTDDMDHDGLQKANLERTHVAMQNVFHITPPVASAADQRHPDDNMMAYATSLQQQNHDEGVTTEDEQNEEDGNSEGEDEVAESDEDGNGEATLGAEGEGHVREGVARGDVDAKDVAAIRYAVFSRNFLLTLTALNFFGWDAVDCEDWLEASGTNEGRIGAADGGCEAEVTELGAETDGGVAAVVVVEVVSCVDAP